MLLTVNELDVNGDSRARARNVAATPARGLPSPSKTLGPMTRREGPVMGVCGPRCVTQVFHVFCQGKWW